MIFHDGSCVPGYDLGVEKWEVRPRGYVKYIGAGTHLASPITLALSEHPTYTRPIMEFIFVPAAV